MMDTIVADLPVPGGCVKGRQAKVSMHGRAPIETGSQAVRLAYALDQAQPLAERHRHRPRLARVQAQVGVARHRDRHLALVPLNPRVDELVVLEQLGRVLGLPHGCLRLGRCARLGEHLEPAVDRVGVGRQPGRVVCETAALGLAVEVGYKELADRRALQGPLAQG